MWAWRRHRQPAIDAGGIFAARFRPALSRLAVARARELGNPLGSRAGTPTGSTDKAGERGARQKAPDAREDMAGSTECTPALSSAGVSRPLNRGRSSTAGVNIVSQAMYDRG